MNKIKVLTFSELLREEMLISSFFSAKWMFDMTQYPLAIADWRSYPLSLFTLFEVDISFINLPVDESFLTPPIVYVVDIAYNLIGSIIVTNVLVVTITDTYSRVAQERQELWRTQVTRTYGLLKTQV